MIKDFGLGYVVHLILFILLPFIWAGIVRVSRGKVLIGILYIITGGFFAIGWIIDLISLLTKKNLTTLF